MSTCSIEKICSFKSIGDWQFDLVDPNLPMKKQKDDENNSLAILMMKDILLNKPADSSSPLQLDFKINAGYKLLVISFLCNSRFVEIYKGGEFYLITSKGVITTTNKNMFEHEHAFSLPDIPEFRFKFLSVKAGWGGNGEVEKEAGFVIRDLKLMFEQTGPTEVPITQPIHSPIVALSIPMSSSSSSAIEGGNLENTNHLLIQEVHSLRQEIQQLKQLQLNSTVPPPPTPPVASILQSDAAILSLLNGLQHRLMKDLSDILDSKLTPIHHRLGRLESSLLSVSNSLSDKSSPIQQHQQVQQEKVARKEEEEVAAVTAVVEEELIAVVVSKEVEEVAEGLVVSSLEVEVEAVVQEEADHDRTSDTTSANDSTSASGNQDTRQHDSREHVADSS